MSTLKGMWTSFIPLSQENGNLWKLSHSSQTSIWLVLNLLVHACSVTAVMSQSLRPRGLKPTRLLCPWGFSRQEYWSGLPFPPPGDLPDPGIEPQYLTSLTLAGKFFTTSFNLLTYYYFKCPQKILLSTFNIVLPRCQEKKVL